VDESVRGAPGRAVLKAVGTTNAVNQAQTVRPATARRPPVPPNAVIEVSASVAAFVNGAPVAPRVQAVLWTSLGNQIGAAIDLGVALPRQPQHGEAVQGVRTTFRRAFGRLTTPANAAMCDLTITVTGGASGSTLEIDLLKPLVAVLPTGKAEPITFDPGLHAAVDSQLPVWPSILRGFSLGQGGERSPDRVEFQGVTGRPASRRLAFDPPRRLNATIRCDPVQRAVLEAFHRDTPGDFYIVEPDSDRLCVASFAAEGAPRMTEDLGEVALMSVGLWLETA